MKSVRLKCCLSAAVLLLTAGMRSEGAVPEPSAAEVPSVAPDADFTDSDTLLLTVSELFERGMSASLVLRADTLNEEIAAQELRSARLARTPDISVSLTGGYVGQPTLFRRGLSDPTFPETPDWTQNYSVDVTQPLYEGGRIRRTIRRAESQEKAAGLQTASDAADIKLGLMEQ